MVPYNSRLVSLVTCNLFLSFLEPVKWAVPRADLSIPRPHLADRRHRLQPLKLELEAVWDVALDVALVMEWLTVMVCLGLRQFLGCGILLLKSGKPRQTRTSWSPYLAAQSLTCAPPPPVPFRETPSYAKRRRLAGPSGLASPRPLQRSASDINLKGEVQPAASPGPSLRSLPHQLLLQRLQEEKDRDRDGDQENDISGPTAGRGSQSKIR